MMGTRAPVRGGMHRYPQGDMPRAVQNEPPVILTAQPLLRLRPDLEGALRGAGYAVRAVASWDRLVDAVEHIRADAVLLDLDAADHGARSRHGVSGHRIATLLARSAGKRSAALIVLTRLDYAEVEDLARAGVAALVSPHLSTRALVAQLRALLARYALLRRGTLPVCSGRAAAEEWQLSEPLWRQVAVLLPPAGARARVSDRQVLDAALFVLRAGVAWSALPPALGSAGTVRRRLQAWERAGVLGRLRETLAAQSDELRDLPWGRLAPRHASARRVAADRRTAVA
jgi:transposase